LRILNIVISAVSVPLALANLLGGVGAGIWLAILGQWKAVGIGLAIGVGGHFLINLMLMPRMLLAGAALSLTEKNKPGVAYLGFLGLAYTHVIVAVWCVGILAAFSALSTTHTRIPMLFLSYEAATGPWAYLAYRDQQSGGNVLSGVAVFFAEVGYLASVLLLLLSPVRTGLALAAMCVIIAFGLVIQCVYVAFTLREEGRASTMNPIRLLTIMPRVFKRAFARSGDVAPEERPRGYKWGYVFATVNAIFGLGAGAVAAIALAAPVSSPDDFTLLLVSTYLLAIIALITIATSVCAFIRRHPVCYLVVTVGLVANLALGALQAVLQAAKGQWGDVVRSLLWALLGVAWLAYFGNRKHQFGYLRGPSEQLDVVKD